MLGGGPLPIEITGSWVARGLQWALLSRARKFLEHFSAPDVLPHERAEIGAGAEGADGMQTLRDAATLGILILLALTVRVDLDGKPIDLDIAAPAEAAVDRTAPIDLRPASIVEPAPAGEPDPTAHDSGHRSVAVVTQDIALPALPRTTAPGQEGTERREFVWEVDGKRFVIILGDEPPTESAAPSAAAPEPCDGTLRARLSC